MKDKSGYLKWGLTIFLTVCAILVFYDTFYMSGALQRLLSKLASILSPVLVGLVMAYLLAPIVNWFEKLILAGLHRIKGLEGKTIPHAAGWLRAVCFLLTWASVLLLLYLMFSVVIPQHIDSVVMLINNAETYYNKIYGWITNLLDKTPVVEDWVNENLETYYQNLLDLLTNKVLPGAQQMLTTITGGVISGIWGLVSFAMDFLVGIIVSVYMLAMKEQSLARCCKLLYGVCKEAHARWLAAHPNVNIIIQGNTDERGGREYNLALGQKRSGAVKRRLQLLGIPAERIEAVSFGREKPVAYGHSEEAWAQNRRADIVYPTEVTSGKAAQ